MTTARTLSEKHQRALSIESAISAENITLRGYWTARTSEDRAYLRRQFGFADYQFGRGDVLVLEYEDAEGNCWAQVRPDAPLKDRPKYESPPKKDKNDPSEPGRYGLDIPKACRERVLCSSEELWITEGCKKSDALVSAGLCAVSLPGVWMFTRKGNDDRAKPLPDFDLFPLSGRVIVLCYDSDAMLKPSVYAALKRLTSLLRRHGATLRYCYLPDDGEKKVGVDDYLAAGHSIEELQALVTDKLEPIATAPVQALIHALNRRCKGKATFQPKRADLTTSTDKANSGIAVLREIGKEWTEIDGDLRMWVGDILNYIDFEWGTKGEQLTLALGEGRAKQAPKWQSVMKRFCGERDYFRHAADYWFLDAIAPQKVTNEMQDDLLAEHLNNPFTRERLLARIAEMTGIPQEENRRTPGGRSAGGMMSGQAWNVLLARMRPEDRQEIEEIERLTGEKATHQAMARLFPDALHWLVLELKSWANASEFPPEESREVFPPSYSSIEENLEAPEPEEEEPSFFPPGEKLEPSAPLILSSQPDVDETNSTPDALRERDTRAPVLSPGMEPFAVEAVTVPPLAVAPPQSASPSSQPSQPLCWRCRMRPALGTAFSPHFCLPCAEAEALANPLPTPDPRPPTPPPQVLPGSL